MTLAGSFQRPADVGFDFDEPVDHDVLAILQCSKSKQDGIMPAREKYHHKRANLFRKSRAYVQALDLDYIILSGKYGALRPEDQIDDYDVPVTARKEAEWRMDVVDALEEKNIDLDNYDELRLLVGQDYWTRLRNVFEDADAQVTLPLSDCGGYGYMVGKISDWVDTIDGGDQP